MTISSRDTVFGDLETEFASTRKALERLPEDQFEWAPHEKSMTLGALANHITNIPGWQGMILTTEGFDMAGPRPPSVEATSVAGVLEAWDTKVAELHGALAAFEDAGFEDNWALTAGDDVIFGGTKAAIFRRLGTSHLVHHRAQLGVYLRMLDVPVPAMFGPSADEDS